MQILLLIISPLHPVFHQNRKCIHVSVRLAAHLFEIQRFCSPTWPHAAPPSPSGNALLVTMAAALTLAAAVLASRGIKESR